MIDSKDETQSGEAPVMVAGAGSSDLIGQTLATIERWAIEETLKMTGDNREEAAKILKIGSRTLYRRLDQYKENAE